MLAETRWIPEAQVGIARSRSHGGTSSNASMGTDDVDVAAGERVLSADGGLMDPCDTIGVAGRDGAVPTAPGGGTGELEGGRSYTEGGEPEQSGRR